MYNFSYTYLCVLENGFFDQFDNPDQTNQTLVRSHADASLIKRMHLEYLFQKRLLQTRVCSDDRRGDKISSNLHRSLSSRIVTRDLTSCVRGCPLFLLVRQTLKM